MKKIFLLTAMLLAGYGMSFAQTKVVAHRGFWDTPGSAQNSIASLVKADSIGCYGSEFDVWLTKDKKLVIHHDPTVKDLSIEKSKYKELLKYPLSNGEKIPTLQDYLKAGKRLKTRLICEIKPHKTEERTLECVDRTVKAFDKAGLNDRVTYISFSLAAVRHLISIVPLGTEVYYLNGELTPAQLKDINAAGADYHYGVINKHPDWIDACHRIGMKVNVWTVNDTNMMRKFVEQKVDFITTNDPVNCLQIVKQR